jgi:hypothetical protein
MFKSLSTSLIMRGVLAVIVGIVAIAWPGVTILALVILFAVYAFMNAGLEGARAFSSRTAGPVIGRLGSACARSWPTQPEPGCLRHARRARFPHMLVGFTRMKCAGIPSIHGSSPASTNGARSASVSR